MSKDVKYVGTLPAELPSLGLAVIYGDVITVPDDFDNGSFTDVLPVIEKSPRKTEQPAQSVTSTETTASAE